MTTKKACERYQNLPKEEKEKKQQYHLEWYKNYQKIKNESWLSIKNIIKWEKMSYCNYKKLFLCGKFKKREGWIS